MVAITRYYHAEDQYLETFTELQHLFSKALYLQWPAATRTHPLLIVRLPAFKSKLVFWEYQDSQFLTLLSYGGTHCCVAACRAEEYGVLYFVVFCTLYFNAVVLSLYDYLLLEKDRFLTPLAVSHKPSFLSTFLARMQSLVHQDIKLTFLQGDNIAY